MRIVLAPDKFRGSLDAAEVAAAMAEGARRIDHLAELDLCPVADGGEGFVAALVAATGGSLETRRVTGPLPDMKVDATFGMLGGPERAPNSVPHSPAGPIAVIEMSAASGLALLAPEDRDPMRTTTFGTGELMLEAARLGARRILLGIGGSATVDGGIGCAQACGLPVILDGIGPADPREPLVGEDLSRVVLVKHARGSILDRVRITVACDVTNPLYGPNGAARTYGPQKGATPAQVEQLDQLLEQLARRCGKLNQANAPGAGAAGGLGFAMLAFFSAELRAGFDLVADATALRDRLRGADLGISGEGRFDRSSLNGKAAASVARLCREMNIPCVALAGSIASDELRTEDDPFLARFAIADGPMTLEESAIRARELIASAAAHVVAVWRAGRR
jgi:glycerate kinase